LFLAETIFVRFVEVRIIFWFDASVRAPPPRLVGLPGC
jgi:hypothetical protein